MDSIDNIVKRLRESRISEASLRYSEMDHDDLIELAQGGDQRAFEELLAQYNPLIEKQARRYFLDNGTAGSEDMKQIASVGFWEAVKSYDPKVHRGGFGGYASLIMNRKLSDLIRGEDADVRKLNNLSTSANEPVLGDEDEKSSVQDTIPDKKLSPEEQYLGAAGAREILDFLKSSLSETERDVLRMYIKGYKVSEISEETGMKYKSVENAIKRVKDKLAAYLRARESKKIRESKSIEFSEEEKEILNSVLNKINESEMK